MFTIRLARAVFGSQCPQVVRRFGTTGILRQNGHHVELGEDPVLLKLRRIKRAFAAILFGGTFATVAYFRRCKAEKLRQLLEGCERLPDDPNFLNSKPLEFFRYKSCILPGEAIKSGIMRQLEEFEARPDDVFVVGFPRTGTTWLQEIVYLVQNNLSFEKAADDTLEERFPTLEGSYPGLRTVENMSSPRLIKSQLPYWLLPESVLDKGSKMIYIVRNPKDVAVSYYHFVRLLVFTNYIGTFEEFLDKFMKDEVPFSPFFKHALSYWEHREDPNVLFLFYEDLQRDPESVIKRVSHFLDRPVTDDQAKLLLNHTRFANMSENPAVNYSQWHDLGFFNRTEPPFLRKGAVGDWKSYFTSRIVEKKFNSWSQEALKEADLDFQYDL